MENEPNQVNTSVVASPKTSQVKTDNIERVSSPTKENEPLSPSKSGKEVAPSEPSAAEFTPEILNIPQKVREDADKKDDEMPLKSQAETAACEQKLFVVETHHDTEEVLERLLDVKGLEQGVSGLWGWMAGGITKVTEQAKTVAETATKVAEKASQQASVVAKEASQKAAEVAEKASQQASIVAEKASKAKSIAEQQAKELAASVSKTIDDVPANATPKSPATFPVAYLPWESAHPDRRAEARERVMKLSLEDQTFTIPPPKEAKYVYDATQREPYAARMLETDALLSAKRFKLVPKVVDEQEFWRNYFYRVDLILNALGVPATPDSEQLQQQVQAKNDETPKQSRAVEAARMRDLEEEMRKEIAKAEASHLEDTVKEDENFDMLDDELDFEDDPELEKSIRDLKL